MNLFWSYMGNQIAILNDIFSDSSPYYSVCFSCLYSDFIF